jgi:acetyl-CoA carboxylase biotin carboxyl carrier protein
MDIEFIERLIELAARSCMTELDYSEGDCRIRIVKSQAGGVSAVPVSGIAAASVATTQLTPPQSSEHKIVASLVGSFFRAPTPGGVPFVTVGDIVAEGDTLAIIEAMKTMIPVESDIAGRIVEIFPDDGAPVEAGTILFVIAPPDET